MNKPTGVTQANLLSSHPQPILPRPFRGRFCGVLLAILSTIALEIPANPAFAAAVCTAMKRGDRGETVKALQQTLSNNGYNVGAIDGIFGEQTEIALKLLQRKLNLNVDGAVGTSTCTALINLSNSELVAASTAPVTTTAQPATTTASSSTGGILKKGDAGPEVTALQNALKARGFETLVVTGKFDQATEDTVRQLQSFEGLPTTGVMDQPTKDSLNAYLDNQLKAAEPVIVTVVPPANPAPAIAVSPNPVPANPVTAPLAVPAAPQTTSRPVEFSVPAQPSPTSVAVTPNVDEPSATNRGAYIVAVPVRGNDTLMQVQTYIPQAILDRSRRGSFVNAGVFRNRYDAESISNSLKARGLDARVFVP